MSKSTLAPLSTPVIHSVLGEAMVLVYFSFTKSSSGFRCFRAVFLLYSNCIIMPSRRCLVLLRMCRYKYEGHRHLEREDADDKRKYITADSEPSDTVG